MSSSIFNITNVNSNNLTTKIKISNKQRIKFQNKYSGKIQVKIC